MTVRIQLNLVNTYYDSNWKQKVTKKGTDVDMKKQTCNFIETNYIVATNSSR